MKKLNVAAVLVVAGVLVAACGKKEGSAASNGVDAGSFDKAALLRAFGECALESYKEVTVAAGELAAATEKADVDQTPASREAAREAWKKTIDAWQRAEPLAFGPGAKTGAPGGRSMREPIYSWPLVNRCVIEQQLVAQTYAGPELASALVNTKGLAAVELLLFLDGAENACPASAEINANGSWAALGADEIARRKLGYARAAAAEVASHAGALEAAWDPARGNFLGEMVEAGRSKTFASQQMAFNVVSDALFYTDIELKNHKVGMPAGLVLGACAAPPCLDAVESPWAKRSKEHLRNNLVGFERLTRGCGPDGAGLGFEELLVAVGAEEVAVKITSATADIRGALDALVEPTLEEDLVKNAPGVQRLFDTLRALATILKSELVTVLDLEIPKPVEGDND